MWEKLQELDRRYAEIGELLEIPDIYADPAQLKKLTREQKELEGVVEAYRAYRRAEATIEESEALLSDPELAEMAREELKAAKEERTRLFDELRILLLPKDPNDGKNVIMSCAAAWAARKAPCLPMISTGCTLCTPKSRAGSWN